MGVQNAIFITLDEGLKRHWVKALGEPHEYVIADESPLSRLDLQTGIVWVDLATPKLPTWTSEQWSSILQQKKMGVIAASSSPNDDEGIAALDAGCVAYCHAFSDAVTLRRVQQVVRAGNVWIGQTLMTRLLKNTAKLGTVAPDMPANWQSELTTREIEVAKLAASGASNLSIASNCNITERTVKAHLSAVFEKLHVKDRLQLALKVHGIQ